MYGLLLIHYIICVFLLLSICTFQVLDSHRLSMKRSRDKKTCSFLCSGLSKIVEATFSWILLLPPRIIKVSIGFWLELHLKACTLLQLFKAYVICTEWWASLQHFHTSIQCALIIPSTSYSLPRSGSSLFFQPFFSLNSAYEQTTVSAFLHLLYLIQHDFDFYPFKFVHYFERL